MIVMMDLMTLLTMKCWLGQNCQRHIRRLMNERKDVKPEKA